VQAIYYSEFKGPVAVQNVPDPSPEPDGVVIRVEASGLCRSDWHGWMGHDSDIVLPHVPGHELAGVVEAVGTDVLKWQPGDRVTMPFVCGCGSCPQCSSGNQQVCDKQFQPGFTHWGSFAEYVAVRYADLNLVEIPDSIDFITAASLGCRFATSFRAIVDQGKAARDQWVAVHGCGGVGLSAIMIAHAVGARVIAVDISSSALDLAHAIGAEACINVTGSTDVAGEIIEISGGGAHLSVDALGQPEIVVNSISCLRKQGKHLQVGLLDPEHRNARIPTGLVIARELEILGSHGMQAHRYPQMLDMILAGRLRPDRLIGKVIDLHQAARELVDMNSFTTTGVTVIGNLRP